MTLEIGDNLLHLLILIGAGLSPVVAATSAYITHKAGKRITAAVTAGSPGEPPTRSDQGATL